MHARAPVATGRLPRYLKKGVLVSVLLLVLLLRGRVLRSKETYGFETQQGLSHLFLSPGAIEDPQGKLGQRKLFHVPARHLYLPVFFNLIDLEPSSKDEHHNDFNCTLTSTTPKFHICVYPNEEDIFISAALTSQGVWEPYITKLLQLALTKFPEAVVIDVGANIGYYSLLAAAMGHQVVAVEPSPDNVRRLRRGAQLNGAIDKVYVLQNALSKTHRNVSLSQNPSNQGGIQVVEDRGRDYPQTVQTIVLDDLLHLIHSNTAIIKIDIEGYECQGMAASAKLLRSVYVPYILMEWQQMYKHRHLRTTACPIKIMRQMTDYLVRLGYHAHEVRTGMELNPYRSTSAWQIGDVYWRHDRQPPLIPPL